jgi:hypothetical protein
MSPDSRGCAQVLASFGSVALFFRPKDSVNSGLFLSRCAIAG